MTGYGKTMARRKGLTFYQKKKKLNIALIHEIISWIFWIVMSIILALLPLRGLHAKHILSAFLYETSIIGSSMEPSLYNGQEIFLNRLVYKITSPKAGDVVVFLPNGNEKSHYYVKRVVAVPGDELYVKNGILYVNNEVQDEYINDKIAEAGLAENKIELGDDEYFVIGDNCNNSEDSRSANIGNIKKEHIIGKAWFKMAAQSSSMGFVN